MNTMTDSVEVYKTQQIKQSNVHRLLQRSNSTDAVTGSRTSLPPVEAESGPEETDQQKENSLSSSEMHNHSTGEAGAHNGQVAPDGGWGWVVLAATVLVLAMTLAFPSCIGIFYTDLQKDFQASNTETSWVPAIMMAVLHAGGRDRSSYLCI